MEENTTNGVQAEIISGPEPEVVEETQEAGVDAEVVEAETVEAVVEEDNAEEVDAA